MQHHILIDVTAKNTASIMTKNNTFVSGLMGDQFKMEMVVTQTFKEETKILAGLPVSLPETQNNTEGRLSMYSTVKLKKEVI